MQDSVAPPEPVTVAGLTLQLVLLVARLTTPENPLNAVTVTVEDPGVPTRMVRLVGLAVTE